MIKALGLALLLALTPPSLACAQSVLDSQSAVAVPVRGIAPRIGGTVPLPAATASNAAALPASAISYDSLTITNAGASAAYVGLGASAVTGTPDVYLPAGATVCLSAATAPGTFASQLAAITAAGSTTLYVAQATACLPTAGGGQAITHVAVAALSSSLIAKAASGSLYGFNCSAITGGAPGYCVAIAAASAPSNGAAITPLDACYFSSVAGCSLLRNLPANYSGGIVILVTSAASPFTDTNTTDTAFISGDVQ